MMQGTVHNLRHIQEEGRMSVEHDENYIFFEKTIKLHDSYR